MFTQTQRVRNCLWGLSACIGLFAFCTSDAATQRHFAGRIIIDGYSHDFTPDEALFGVDPSSGFQRDQRI